MGLQSLLALTLQGRTSNCFRITYRSMERSLTDEEINALQVRLPVLPACRTCQAPGHAMVFTLFICQQRNNLKTLTPGRPHAGARSCHDS